MLLGLILTALMLVSAPSKSHGFDLHHNRMPLEISQFLQNLRASLIIDYIRNHDKNLFVETPREENWYEEAKMSDQKKGKKGDEYQLLPRGIGSKFFPWGG